MKTVLIYGRFHWCVVNIDETKILQVYNCDTEFKARYIAELQGYNIIN